MTCDGSTSCTCSACVARRHSAWEKNDLIQSRRETVKWGEIPQHQALAYRIEEKEILERQLAITETEIRILKDCAGV